MNLSFAGCGFLGIYHVGVASCFREYAPHVFLSKIAGASVGSIAAAALICDVSLGDTTTDVLRVAVKARARTLGPLHPGFDLNHCIREGLEKALPKNAHLLCSGKLFISVTRFQDGKNFLLSEFNSREELIQALLCSCFIPVYSGLKVPVFQGMNLCDGGFSDNLPVLDDNTITVSPFAGEHDICPQDESYNILQVNLANTSIAISPGNLYRVARILFPPHPEILSKMCQQGFDDALKFLQRNKLISCTRCMAVQSSLSLAEKYSENENENSSGGETELEHAYDDCIDCRYRRQMALLDSLPESVVNAIQEACDQVNKGIINWLFRHRPVKLLSFLGLPYVLPIDISILIFLKIWQKLPQLQKEIQAKFQNIIALIKSLLSKIDQDRHLYSAKFSCQLAITEYDYTEETVTSSYAIPTNDIPPHETCKLITEKESSPLTRNLQLPHFAPMLTTTEQKRQQRKSYAGFVNNGNHSREQQQQRRKSTSEISQPPERVIRNMKFGFTIDLTPSITTSDKKNKHVVDALKSLGEEDSELNVIEITNKALNWERECIGQYRGDIQSENADTLGQLLNATNNGGALMSYYYVDENKTVNVTELYNVDDADTSAVLSEEERETNSKLQWEHDWPSAAPNISITDTFDDTEFDMSDEDLDLVEDGDSVNDLQGEGRKMDRDSAMPFDMPKPKRKTSFIIIN